VSVAVNIGHHHAFEPRGGNRDAFTSRASEILLSGPAGTGKSRTLLERLHFMALKYPGMRGIILRKTLASMGSTALATWRHHVLPEALKHGIVDYYGGSASEPPQYRYVNGSRIFIGGMDKATRIMSSEYDVAYVQEAIELTENDWEAILTRLRNGKIPYQILLADTNPDKPTHWLKARCDRGQTQLIESRHEDNPFLFYKNGKPTPNGEAYIAKLDSLTGVRKARLRRGLWVASEGMIYEEWDSLVHHIPRFWVNRNWQRIWAVDFGFTNPFVWQNWAIDEDGRMYLIAEIYQTRMTVDVHAANILKVVTHQKGDYLGQWNQPKPSAIVCDHDAEGRAQLERHLGLSTKPARKNVTEGIQAVQQRLRIAEDGKPRLFICKDSLKEKDTDLIDSKKPSCTADEIPGYIWDPGAKSLDGRVPKEQPLKIDDHGCDAMRYAVSYLDRAPKPRVRFM
jgi:PBSX family phage terminase large subunit